MSTDSSDENDHGFSTQDQETLQRLLAMDRETFLANWDLESTRQSAPPAVSQHNSSRMDISDDGESSSDNTEDDSESSLENDYLEVLRNPPVVEDSPIPPPVDNANVITEPQLMEIINTTTTSADTISANNSSVTQQPGRRSLRPRKVSQIQPYTYENKKYNEVLRRTNFLELLHYNPNNSTQPKRRHKKTSEDRYEDEGIDEDDEDGEMINPDDEFEQVDPEELMPVKRIKKLIIPTRRRKSQSEEPDEEATPSKKMYSPTYAANSSAVHGRRITTAENASGNSGDIWTKIPRTKTVYSVKSKNKSNMRKGNGSTLQPRPMVEMDNSAASSTLLPKSTYTEKFNAEAPKYRSSEHTNDALRDVFPDLYDSVLNVESSDIDHDAKSIDSKISLDSVLIRAAELTHEDQKQQTNDDQLNPSFEDWEGEEQLHIPRRKKRLRRSHSLDDENDNEDDRDIFDFPTEESTPTRNDNNDDIFDFPAETQDPKPNPLQQRPLQQLIVARSRRKQRTQSKDDGFIVHDGSEYDLPKRRKQFSLRGVLPFNYNPNHEKPVINQRIEEEEENNDQEYDSPMEEDPPELLLTEQENISSMPLGNEANTPNNGDDDSDEFQSFLKSSPVRRRQRTLTGYVQRSSRSGEKTYTTKKAGRIDQMRKEAVSRARSLQTKTPRRRSSNKNSSSTSNTTTTNNPQRNRNSTTTTLSSSSQNKSPLSALPRRPKKRNLNGELYIHPGPGIFNNSVEQKPELTNWQSSIRPHLSIRWTDTGELCPEPDDSVYTSSPPPEAEIYHLKQRLQHMEEQVNSNGPSSCFAENIHLQVIEDENNGPTDPLLRLLIKHPNLAIDWGMPRVDGTAQLQKTIYLQHGYLYRLTSPQEDTIMAQRSGAAGLFDDDVTPIGLFDRHVLLTQNIDKDKVSIKNLFREAFKHIGALFDNRFKANPSKRDIAVKNLFLFFQFVTEALNNWVLRLPSGQQRPMIEFLNSQCRLLYSRAWSIAGLDNENYKNSRPLFSFDQRQNNTLSHAWKVIIALLIYALDWTSQIRQAYTTISEFQEDCKQRLLWLLYWMGPTLAQLKYEQNEEPSYIDAKEPLVAEGWICLFHLYMPEDANRNQCWLAVMELLEHQREQDHLTARQEMERKWHWLLALNALRYVDKKGIYTRPEGGISTVETMCGGELANELSAAIAENELSGDT